MSKSRSRSPHDRQNRQKELSRSPPHGNQDGCQRQSHDREKVPVESDVGLLVRIKIPKVKILVVEVRKLTPMPIHHLLKGIKHTVHQESMTDVLVGMAAMMVQPAFMVCRKGRKGTDPLPLIILMIMAMIMVMIIATIMGMTSITLMMIVMVMIDMIVMKMIKKQTQIMNGT